MFTILGTFSAFNLEDPRLVSQNQSTICIVSVKKKKKHPDFRNSIEML